MKKPKFTYTDSETAEAHFQREKERRRSQGSLNAQSKRNQNLGYSIDRLNLIEIAFFIKQAIAFLQDPETRARKKTAILAMLVSLWVSRPIDDVANFKIIRRLQSWPPHEGIYFVGDQLFWILHSPGPDVEGVKLTDQSPTCMVKKFVQLKVPQSVENLIMPHMKSMSAEKKHNNLFDIGTLSSQYVGRVLSEIRNERYERLNLSRIARYFFWELASHPSADVATAVLLTGGKASHETTPYYTTLGENRLQAIYENVAHVLENKFGLAEAPSLLFEYTMVKNLPEPDIYLGSPFRPLRSAVQSLISTLKDEIKDFLKKKHWSIQDIIHFQKPYALYCWLMYAFSVGARPVDKPRFHSRQISLSSGLAILSDKDKDGRENARRVWLWDEMRNQVDNYYEHVAVLFDRIGSNVPSLRDLFKNHGPNEAVGYLFLIDAKYKLQPLTPGRIEEILKTDYSYEMPSNSHRHYLRSSLLERGCHVETIDAFMGHEKLGQEPWTKYSALVPAEFVDSLRKYLVPLLQEDGWCALNGLTWENRR